MKTEINQQLKDLVDGIDGLFLYADISAGKVEWSAIQTIAHNKPQGGIFDFTTLQRTSGQHSSAGDAIKECVNREWVVKTHAPRKIESAAVDKANAKIDEQLPKAYATMEGAAK